jgi:CDP-glycerol glycerophosphotransferase (TagB/SpsB family)
LYKKDKSFKPIIVGKEVNTYELLNACDLAITKWSTTGLEAIALNKPLLILNLGGEPDRVEYVKEGVALGVYNEKDLTPTIEKSLKDDSELAKNRGKYLEKYLYKIDGKATERVVNLIGEMIKERREK